ncbi:MAG: M28 family peptidase [Candidatus Sumerlaeia bacterium]
MGITRWAVALVFILWAQAAGAGFDAGRAAESIRKQCGFGPRVPGTAAHEACRRWIGDQLRGLGLTVREQAFETTLPLTGKTARCVNIWGVPAADGPTSPALIISAHWDTRPYADRDPSGGNPPMLGANDGAAGVAMALELYRALGDSPLKNHVALAFWDAEDAGKSGPGLDATWALGARYGAAHKPGWIGRVRVGINLDMPAGADLVLCRDQYSTDAAGWAMAEIWQIGRDLAPSRFSDEVIRMTDDHRPWIDAGVPFIDLVGWPYAYWHTAGDTPERCDAQAMHALAEVLEQFVRNGSWK